MTEFGGADYGLPLEFLEQTFQEAIVPDYLLRGHPLPQPYPEAVLLGGQPGAASRRPRYVFVTGSPTEEGLYG